MRILGGRIITGLSFEAVRYLDSCTLLSESMFFLSVLAQRSLPRILRQTNVARSVGNGSWN